MGKLASRLGALEKGRLAVIGGPEMVVNKREVWVVGLGSEDSGARAWGKSSMVGRPERTGCSG